jgi:hypothetical protein
MPRTPINLDPFQHQIQLRIAAGETHTQIHRWLATEGIQISKNIFSKRYVAWEVSRRTRTPATDPVLLSEIDSAFHTTHHDDETIARNITAQGLPTTPNQVQEIRLTRGWLRRGNNDAQLAYARD